MSRPSQVSRCCINDHTHAHALSNPHLLLRAHVFFSARVSRFDVAVAFTFAFHSATVTSIFSRVDFQSFRCFIPSRSGGIDETTTNDNSFRSLFPSSNLRFSKQRFSLPCLVSYDIREYRTEYRSLSSLLFFPLPDEKQTARAFVNGNIEKSYKFGAVYPQNFTFFQYRVRVSVCIRNELTPRIRKIRIYRRES